MSRDQNPNVGADRLEKAENATQESYEHRRLRMYCPETIIS